MTPDRYTYVVCWSDEDQEFVGRCTKFPSLSHLAESHEQALAGIRELVADTLEDMKRHGETPP